MLVTLIPLFDKEMSVRAYSLFTQKNVLQNPSLQGTGSFDGAAEIQGLDIIESMGIETLSSDKEVFIEVSNISVFADINSQCTAPHERVVLLLDRRVTPDKMYVDRIKELKAAGFKLAMRKLTVQQFEPYKEILLLMDYVFLDHKKIDITKVQSIFFKCLSQC